MKRSTLVPAVAVLSLLAACGKAPSGRGVDNSIAEAERAAAAAAADGSNIDGKYLATFTTLNGHVVGTIPGSATLMRNGDRFYAYVRLFAGSPEAWHPQNVWTGNRCPNLGDDLNGDGTIDIVEARRVLGEIIIPLDADLSSQNGLRNWYPKGDLSGSYFYEKMTSFRRFWADLKNSRGNSDFKKLGPDEGLALEGKAVLIQGVGADKELPESVESEGRWRPFQTLPIACGIFRKVNELPGTEWSDEVAGPVAPVEEGQDRPAEPGAGVEEGDGNVRRGSNSAGSVGTNTTNGGGGSSTDTGSSGSGSSGSTVNTGNNSGTGTGTGSGTGTSTGTGSGSGTGTGSGNDNGNDDDPEDSSRGRRWRWPWEN
jgi:hypothetical protein